MQNFDNALKELFQEMGTSLFTRLGGSGLREMLNVEISRTRARRADLLAWLANGVLFHLEFQSTNDRKMVWRMLDYYLLLYRFGVAPRQVVLYLGQKPLRMEKEVIHERLQFRYDLVDIREFDSGQLASSPHLGDNVLAILGRMPDEGVGVRRIAERVVQLPVEQRERALRLILVLAGIRGLDSTLRKEVETMSVMIDIRKNVFYQEALQEGLQEGWQKGRQEGRQEGRSLTLRRLIEHRFGKLPAWAETRFLAATDSELDRWEANLFSAQSLESLLR